MDQNGSKWIELDFSVIGNHMADSLKIILSIIILSVIEIHQNGLKWIELDFSVKGNQSYSIWLTL